jgi:hypothetical protein
MDEKRIESVFYGISEFARKEYSWRSICARLVTLFRIKGMDGGLK